MSALGQIFESDRVVAFHPGLDGAWVRREGPGEVERVPAADRALLAWFKHNPLVVHRHRPHPPGSAAVPAPLEPLVERHRIDVLVPIVHRRALLGVIGLGLRGRPTDVERAVIHAFWSAASAACARPRLLREVRRQQILKQEVQRVATVRRGMTPTAGEARWGDLEWSGKSSSVEDAPGGFWSVHRPDVDALLVVVGDTQRAGVAGALVAAAIQSCCETLVDILGARTTPEILLATINRMLWRPLRPTLVTCVAVLVRSRAQELHWCNAGHPVPSLASDRGVGALTGGDGPVLGEDPDSVYRAGLRSFGARDALFLPGAGLLATQNPEGHALGTRRFLRLLAGLAPGKDATAWRDALLTGVAGFRGTCRQRHDESLVVIRNRAVAAAGPATDRSAMEEGRLRLDLGGLVVEADDAALELLRGGRDEIVGRAIAGFLGSPLTVGDLSGRACLRSIRRVDRSELVVGLVGAVQRGRGGEPLGLVCVLRPPDSSAGGSARDEGDPWETRFAAAGELVAELLHAVAAAEESVALLHEAFAIMLEVCARYRGLLDHRGGRRLGDRVRAIEDELDWSYLGTAIPHAIDAVAEAVARARTAIAALLEEHRVSLAAGDPDRLHLAAAICRLAVTHIDRLDDDLYLLRGGCRELDQVCRLYRQLLSDVIAGDPGSVLRRQLHDAEAEADIAYLEPNIPSTLDRMSSRLGSIASAAGSVRVATGAAEGGPVSLEREVRSAVDLARIWYEPSPRVDVAIDPGAARRAPEVPGACARALMLLLLHGFHQLVASPGLLGTGLSVLVERQGDEVEIRVSDPGGSLAAAGWTLDDELDRRTVADPCSGAGQGLSEVRRLVVGALGWRLGYRTGGDPSFVVAVPSSTATTVTSSSGSSPAV